MKLSTNLKVHKYFSKMSALVTNIVNTERAKTEVKLSTLAQECKNKDFNLTDLQMAYEKIEQELRVTSDACAQGCGSVFIFYGSGSGSRAWCWRPIRIRIQYGSWALMTKNWKKITAENFFLFFFDQKLQFTYP